MNKNTTISEPIAEQKSNRLIYFDALRILAAFAVVMIHTTAPYTAYLLTDDLFIEWVIFVFYNNFSRWAVPVFIMISGSLFLDNNRKLEIKTFFKKNIFRIITAYLFWLVIYALYDKPESIEAFFDNAYHLWFLPMLIGLYIITPVLRKITEDKKITLYFLILSVIFTVVCPMLLEFELFKGFGDVYEQFTRGFSVKYIFYFIAGYYLANINFTKKSNIVIYGLGIIAFLTLPILTICCSLHKNEFYDYFMTEFSIPVMLQSVFIFIFTKNIFEKKQCNEKISKIIVNVSKYTFGIYLIHALVLEIFMDFEIIPIACNVAVSPLIANFVVFFISLLLSVILNHIPLLKKYIV